MSLGPFGDDRLLELVDAIEATPLTARMYRHTSPGRDPLSGSGAFRFGGRWNPPGIATIYLARPKDTAIAELKNMAAQAAISVEDLIGRGRVLHSIEVADLPVLDVTNETSRQALQVSLSELSAEDQSVCKAIGHAAYILDRFSGVLAPSARDTSGQVLAVFEARTDLVHMSFVTTRALTNEDLSPP